MSPPDTAPTPADRMIGGVDVRDIGACACLLARRTARLSTQLFDAHLQPAGLTIGQFGVMARLFAGSLSGQPMTMKDLSSAIGMDPTTLNRTLKPLEAQALVRTEPDARDRRARVVSLTPPGRERLAQAAPLWQAADAALRRTIGTETTVALSGLLDLASEKLKAAA